MFFHIDAFPLHVEPCERGFSCSRKAMELEGFGFVRGEF